MTYEELNQQLKGCDTIDKLRDLTLQVLSNRDNMTQKEYDNLKFGIVLFSVTIEYFDKLEHSGKE